MSSDIIREQIRNSNGSLICDASFSDGIWTVTIKRKGIYTILDLYQNGDITVENYQADANKELGYSVSIPD